MAEKLKTAGKALLFLVPVLVILVVAGIRGGEPRERPTVASPPAEAPVSAGAAPTESAGESFVLTEAEQQELHEAVIRFEEAYWSYDFQESGETRANRLRDMVTPAFYQELLQNFAVTDEFFQKNQLSSRATVAAGDILGSELYDQSRACVPVRVTVTTTAPDGVDISQVPVPTERYYVREGGGWLVDGNVSAGAIC